MGHRGAVLAVALLAIGASPPASAIQNETTLVSMVGAFDGGVGTSDNPAISADGRYVAFHSGADNLSTLDNNGVGNVFVRDVVAQVTTLASAPTGTDGTANDGGSQFASISADGRYVAFESASNNLSTQDNDTFMNIYVRDLLQNTTTLASLPGGTDGTTNNADSTSASISADGRYVAFSSGSDNLSLLDNNSFTNIYVRDLVEKTTTLVSLPDGTNGTGNNANSLTPSISADGRMVAFGSGSDNLSGADNNAVVNVYVRYLDLDDTLLVSLPNGTDGTTNNEGASLPSIAADGSFVAFESGSDNLSTQDNNSQTNVFVRDIGSDMTTLVSLPTGTDGALNNGFSSESSISADGRYVAFHSASDNLSTQDNNAQVNVYVRDVTEDTTTLVSAPTGTDGTGNDDNSVVPSISADGRFVAFASAADNLSTLDDDGANAYLRDVLGPQPPPAFEIADVKAKEGKAGPTTFTFTVTLDGTPGRAVTVDVATKNGTATLGNNDYEFASGTLTFPPGATSSFLNVTVNGDKLREKSETFRVKLFDAVGADIEDPTATGTIRNDDR